MTSGALFWALATVACLAVQGFYSMMEMACVSFNRVRLQFYVSRSDSKAQRLNHLMQHPARLFGTTLIGVNAALQLGSECSRQFYNAIGMHPALAPATQVFLVLVFAELAPMFAARRYSEHVAMLGVGPLYMTTQVMKPVIWIIGWIAHVTNRLVGGRNIETGTVLSRDDLQNIIEESDDAWQAPAESEDFNRVVGNIFALRGKTVAKLMEPIDSVPVIPSNATVGRMRQVLDKLPDRWVALYHRDRANIVAIAHPRDLLRIPDHRQVREFARSPWFITQSTRIATVMQQFKRNNRSIAVVLDRSGEAVGVLSLDTIMSDLFGAVGDADEELAPALIERSFPGDMRIEDFNAQFNTEFSTQDAHTLAELMQRELGHRPEEGETVRLGAYELRASETSLLGAKVISVRSWTE